MRRFAFFALLVALPVALPAQAPSGSIKSPDEAFGFRMGADRQLAAWGEIRKYFEDVAAASNRVELIDAGPTTDGNRLIAAVISAPENIARLEEIRSATLRLSDPRAISEADARGLAAKTPVTVAVGASIHATEVGATQAANELLYTLATSDDAEVAAVLRNTVVILFPSLNPDGHILTVDWYRRWKGTDFEGSPMPWLYHRYVGHDINRDAFMMNMAENRSLADFFYRRWHPQVFLSMHQMGLRGPRFFVPPNYDPIDPNYDPLIWRTAGLLGHAMALAMEERGQSGVVQNAMYDYYWPGYEDSAPLGHNTVCLLTEAAGVQVATPVRISADELRTPTRGLPEYRAQINFPNPWPGGSWTLRHIVDYDLTAARGLLSAAARYRDDLMQNFYRMGVRAIETGSKGGPFAFIIPPEQYDQYAANKLRQLLIDGAVEIQRSLEPFRVADTVYAAGTDLVLMAQPYRAYAKTLLEQQVYPARRQSAGGEPERPYDVAGWTLPMQMGIKIDRIEQTFEPPPSTRLTKTSIPPANLWGERRASYYLIDGRGNAASIAINRLQAAGLEVGWITSPLDVQGYSYDRGAIVVSEDSKDQARPLVENIAAGLGLRATAIRGTLPSTASGLGRPRIGLYKPWVENIDEGWTRFLLEQSEFPFESLNDQQIRAGRLRTRFDAIIIPDQSAERLMNGHAPGTMPPEYTGGLGSEGALALKQFVDEGGTLIALDSATELAITALGLPVENVVRNARPEQFFAPGSILRLTLDRAQPLNYGMPAETAAFFAFSSAFDLRAATPPSGETVTTAPSARVIAHYADHSLLMSGWLEGGDRIAGHGAVVEAQSGQGRAILIGFRAQHRAQSYATFRLLFNALHTAARPLPRTRPGTR
jgi:hypothetical protein